MREGVKWPVAFSGVGCHDKEVVDQCWTIEHQRLTCNTHVVERVIQNHIYQVGMDGWMDYWTLFYFLTSQLVLLHLVQCNVHSLVLSLNKNHWRKKNEKIYLWTFTVVRWCEKCRIKVLKGVVGVRPCSVLGGWLLGGGVGGVALCV